MTSSLRTSFLAVLCLFGGGLIGAMYLFETSTPLRSSFAPAFQLMGHSTKILDGLMARVMPIDSLDEADLGRVIAGGYEGQASKNDPSSVYVNDLLQHQTAVLKKPFTYRAYILEWSQPNAMALPGGVILVTRGLLTAMHSEGELMAVLAHELGHVELGHCFDAVKFELLARKMTRGGYGKIADFAVSMLLHHSFSKTLEDQADEYAYSLISQTNYDVRAVGSAFERLLQAQGMQQSRSNAHANPIRDYFMSHPPLALRKDKFTQRAEVWWQANPTERRFVGAANLAHRRSYYSGFQNEGEWVTKNPTTSVPILLQQSNDRGTT